MVCDERAQEDVNALLFKSFSWDVKPESFHPTQTGQNVLTSDILDDLGGEEIITDARRGGGQRPRSAG